MNPEKRPASNQPASNGMDLSVRRRPQYKTHVGQDVRDVTALITLTRPGDEVVEDEIKWVTKALRAQGIAAAILAAVETLTLNSLSGDNTNTNLNVVTNAFLSVGILLNVIGAFFALLSAYNLDSNLFNVKSVIRGLDDKELEDVMHLPLSPLAKRLARQNSLRPIDRHVVIEEDGTTRDNTLFRQTLIERYSRSIQENKSAGHLATWTMALGFLTFPVGFLCQLQGTQTIAISIPAYTIVGTLAILRFLVIPLQDRLERLTGRRII